MTLNEHKRSFLFSSSCRFISNTAKTGNVYIFVIADIHSFITQVFEVVGRLGENLDFFSPLGFDVQTNSDHKTQKIKLYSVRALKRYLNEKNLIHGRVMATISKFSPQIFETHFRHAMNGLFNSHVNFTNGNRCFAQAGSRLWNIKMPYVQTAKSIDTFKTSLRVHLSGISSDMALCRP